MPQKYQKQLEFQIKDFDADKYTIRAIISSGQPDRQGDMIDQTSWNLDEYKKNPVVLWAHDHWQPAIGKALEIFTNENGMLEAVIQFAVEEYEFAKTIYNLYAGGFMRAFSVGFISKTQDVINGITVLKDNVLYEFSAVNVGADALALAKSKGIDISPLESIKGEEAPIEKEGRVLSSKNRSIIENARDTLNKVLEADSEKILPQKTIVRYNYRKILNRAVRELIKAKND